MLHLAVKFCRLALRFINLQRFRQDHRRDGVVGCEGEILNLTEFKIGNEIQMDLKELSLALGINS